MIFGTTNAVAIAAGAWFAPSNASAPGQAARPAASMID
jgi:hypothetical protein